MQKKNHITQTIYFSLLCSGGLISTLAYAKQQIQQLPVIEIHAEQENSPYIEQQNTSSTKLDLQFKDTPQSISVLTRQQIEDQNLTSASAILSQTPGVTSTQYGQEGAGYTTYYSRGFEITNIQRDGIPTNAASFGGKDMLGLEDSALYERIELIKGSTGLTNGSGNPSASINYVRKRPTKELSGSIHVQAGNWNKYRSQIDVSGALNNDATIRGRTVAVYEQGGNQQDRFHRQNAVFYAALDFDLSEQTVLTTALTAQQIKLDNATAHGFPFVTRDVPAQAQSSFGPKDNPAADYTYSDTEKLNILLGLEHQFNDNWKGVANYSFSKASSDRIYGVAGSGGIVYNTPITVGKKTVLPGQMVVTTGRFEQTPEVHSIDLYTSGKFELWGHEHQLSFGTNGYTNQSDDPSYGRYFEVVNINGWNGYAPKPDILATKRTVVDEQQLGVFTSAQIHLIEPLKLVLGGRLSYWERKVTEQQQKQNGIFTPYAGLIYDILPELSAYVSYTTIFNPSSYKDLNDNYLDPEEGNSIEGGFKTTLLDGRLNASASYFSMKQDNFAVDTGEELTNGTAIYTAVDGAKVKGYELSIAGELLENWNIQGGYTHTNAKDKDSQPLNTEIPKDTFKLFTTYKWNQYTLGGGINWQSKFYNADAVGLAKKLTTQASYALVNLMARYQVNQEISLGLNINNLLDKQYHLNTSNSWGAGRNFIASVNYKF